jgi:hypothetical protein
MVVFMKKFIAIFIVFAITAFFPACGDKSNQEPDSDETFTVSFDTSGGSPKINPIKVAKGESMGTQYPADPQKEGLVLTGWYDGPVKYGENTPITKNLNLKTYYENPNADPKFHIYLGFGQSNMEGINGYSNKFPGGLNVYTNNRFRVLATTNNPINNRTKGNWYTASPPLLREWRGLSPADFFGRTLVELIDDEEITIGVVIVAVSGAGIDMFDKVKYAAYINELEKNPDTLWMKDYYLPWDSKPYARLVEMAALAQKNGVIKGILMHQGETDAALDKAVWRNKVKKIYDDLLSDLGLPPESVPFLAGETTQAHTNVEVKLLTTVSNQFHVISSEGCEASTMPNDSAHFSPEGMVELGKRYGEKMFRLLY